MSKVRDIMTSAPECISCDATIKDAADLMAAKNVGSLPVYCGTDKNNLCGFITDRDIVVHGIAKNKGLNSKILDLINFGELFCVEPEADIKECANIMSQKKVGRLVVKGKEKGCEGIVSMADIVSRTQDYNLAMDALHNIFGAPQAPVQKSVPSK